MKKVNFLRVFVVLALCVLVVSCAGSRSMGGTSKKCGCGLNRGFVGY